MKYSTDSFIGHKDFKLYTHQWLSDKEKAKLILVHGFGEHAKRYEYEAAKFTDAGYSVLAYDHRGHGKSDGTMGYVDSFKNYIVDLKNFISNNTNTEVPYFIYGHSLGGLIVTDYVLQTKNESNKPKGILLTAPALMVSKDTAPLLQKLSGIVGSLLPKVKTVKLDATKISRIKDVVDKYISDPLVYSEGIYARTASEMIKATKSVESRFTDFSLPLLVMHGTEDNLTEPEGSQNLFDNCSSEDKEILLWDGGYHEITRDLEQDKVLAKMVQWMDERV